MKGCGGFTLVEIIIATGIISFFTYMGVTTFGHVSHIDMDTKRSVNTAILVSDMGLDVIANAKFFPAVSFDGGPGMLVKCLDKNGNNIIAPVIIPSTPSNLKDLSGKCISLTTPLSLEVHQYWDTSRNGVIVLVFLSVDGSGHIKKTRTVDLFSANPL